MPPLSVSKTEGIIRKCLDDFFLNILNINRPLEGGPLGQLGRTHEQSTSGLKPSGGTLADFSALSIGDIRELSHSDPGLHEKTIRSKSFSELGESEPINLRQSFNTGKPAFPTIRSNPPPAPRGTSNLHTGESAPHGLLPSPFLPSNRGPQRATSRDDIFKSLEDYITSSFASYECINNSFPTRRPFAPQRTRSDSTRRAKDSRVDGTPRDQESPMSEIDAKTLLIGDIAENGLWWTGRSDGRRQPARSSSHRNDSSGEGDRIGNVSIRSPRVDWTELQKWYTTVCCAGQGWRSRWTTVLESNHDQATPQHRDRGMLSRIDEDISESQAMVRRTLLKVTESLLRRPGQPLKQPEEIRFLMIILGNPLLYPGKLQTEEKIRSRSRSRSRELRAEDKSAIRPPSPSRTGGNPAAQYSGILKRILGLLSNLPNECHHHLVLWFSGFQESQFRKITELIGSFVTYRLTRQHGKRPKKEELDPTAGLIPTLGSGSSAHLHDALDPQRRANSKKNDNKTKQIQYDDDWQIRAAARVMSILFTANSKARMRRIDSGRVAGAQSHALESGRRSHQNAKFMDVSDFYNTLLDYSDLVSDFEAWESKKAKFAFCQYPFFLSIWAKIQIMEYDTRRQMESKAREAFFNSILRSTSISQYMVLKVRRECLVEDSLRGVSEVLGAGGEDIKKGLRIEFKGEEGVDAGGLRKEWFLLLVRDVFNPEHGKSFGVLNESALLIMSSRLVHLRR